MSWVSPWSFHNLKLWLPDRWTPLDDVLLEIQATIEGYNREQPPEFSFLRISWTPWRTLIGLWRTEFIALRGRLSYRDGREPLIIAAIRRERNIRAFSYDGDWVRHGPSGETWYDPEAIADELAVAAPTVSDTAAPAPPRNPAPPASAPTAPREPRRRAGAPSHKSQITAAFNALSDETVRNAADLAELFEQVLDGIPGSRKAAREPARGYDKRTLYRHLAPLFAARRVPKSATK